MQALGYKNATAERANTMMRGWDHFTDNDMDDRGRPTYLAWMDLEIVELLFDALWLHYGIERSASQRAADLKRDAELQAELQTELRSKHQ
jgi:hypothetical protein